MIGYCVVVLSEIEASPVLSGGTRPLISGPLVAREFNDFASTDAIGSDAGLPAIGAPTLNGVVFFSAADRDAFAADNRWTVLSEFDIEGDTPQFIVNRLAQLAAGDFNEA